VQVNTEVPYGADGDGSALSRPSGKPERVVDNHDTHYRLSLLTGETRYDPDSYSLQQYEDRLRSLLAVDDAVEMHQHWLDTDLMAAFNEAVYYPYTSLKYHTLLVAALVDNYRSGAEFDDLWLVVDPADRVVPHRTVFSGERFGLRLTGRDTDRPRATLGARPWRSWASAWGRLTDHPLAVDGDRYDMLLDANLRRIQAWSTALQYLDEFEQWGAAQ
jgi:hypothetical protein